VHPWRLARWFQPGARFEFRAAKQLMNGLLADHARRINAEIAFSGSNS